MKPVEPIITVDLFPPLSKELLGVLKSLTPDEWACPTACGTWCVKDVVAHLLGGNFGRLWQPAEETAAVRFCEPDYEALLNLINRGNAQWVAATRRISPSMLVELLELTDGRLYEHFCSLDPYQPAGIGVAWAGEDASANWFDMAREYTEKWLHQQHIREAVGRPLLLEQRWLLPLLDTFLRALPHTYRNVDAPVGSVVSVQVSGLGGADWTLRREDAAWRLYSGHDPAAQASVQFNPDLAWRLFTRGVSPAQAQSRVHIEGDKTLARQTLEMISIMA